MAARKSGFRLGKADIPTVLGMFNRNDRRHDIASYYGVNPGRIKKAVEEAVGIKPADAHELPPTGAYGMKGRRLRTAVDDALKHLARGDTEGAKKALSVGADKYDENEP